MLDQTPSFPPPSDYVETRGVIFFARLLEKIRLHAAGKLPPDYNLGFNRPDTFDARFCRFWDVDFDALTDRTLAGGTNEEVFDATFAGRLPLNEEQVRVWNGFLAKRGWRDESSEDLADNKRQLGFDDRDDVQTFIDLHDVDEGREVRKGCFPF